MQSGKENYFQKKRQNSFIYFVEKVNALEKNQYLAFSNILFQ